MLSYMDVPTHITSMGHDFTSSTHHITTLRDLTVVSAQTHTHTHFIYAQTYVADLVFSLILLQKGVHLVYHQLTLKNNTSPGHLGGSVG